VKKGDLGPVAWKRRQRTRRRVRDAWLGGTLPEWVAAIGTACATLIAAIALMVTAWDRRRAPATRVNGWPLIEEGIIIKVVLVNADNLPVFDVIARVIYQRETLEVVSPNSLPPGNHEYELSEAVELWAGAADLIATRHGPKVAVLFRDASGRVWRKRSSGRLRRQRFRRYEWSKEYRNALDEKPPLVLHDLEGNEVPPDKPRRHPRQWI
jgi:hypothetical protein